MIDPHQDNTTDIYNKEAETYKESTQDFIFSGGMFDIFIDKLSGNKVLDIGCAFGRDVKRMRERGIDAIGIDVSEGLLSLADSQIKDFLQKGDMTQLNSLFDEEYFDGIFSAASIVHFEKEVGVSIIKNCFSLLKNSGIFFLGVKISNEKEKDFTESYSIPGVFKKYIYYSPKEIEDILKNVGFNIIKSHVHSHKGNKWVAIIAKK